MNVFTTEAQRHAEEPQEGRERTVGLHVANARRPPFSLPPFLCSSLCLGVSVVNNKLVEPFDD